MPHICTIYVSLVDDVILAFRTVLTHPKINADLDDVQPGEWVKENREFIFSYLDQSYKCSVLIYSYTVNVVVTFEPPDVVPDPVPRSYGWKPFYEDKFKKNTPKSVRKSALNFGKKLRMKSVYDVIDS